MTTNSIIFVQNVLNENYYSTCQRPKSELPSAGDPFLAPNKRLDTQKCFIFLTFYNHIWLLESKNPFSILMPSPVRKDLRPQLTCTWRQEFSRLVNPDWLIQMSGAPAAWKDGKKQRQSSEPIKTQTQASTWCKSSLLCAYYVLTFKQGKTCVGKRQRSWYRTKSRELLQLPKWQPPYVDIEIHAMFR